jgi:hypothetical protein
MQARILEGALPGQQPLMRRFAFPRSFPLRLVFQFCILLFLFISVFLCAAHSCLYSLHLLDHSFFFIPLASVSPPPLLVPSHSLSTLPPLFCLRDDHYTVLVLKVRRFDLDKNEVSRNKSAKRSKRKLFRTFTYTYFCLYIVLQLFASIRISILNSCLEVRVCRRFANRISGMEFLLRSYKLIVSKNMILSSLIFLSKASSFKAINVRSYFYRNRNFIPECKLFSSLF